MNRFLKICRSIKYSNQSTIRQGLSTSDYFIINFHLTVITLQDLEKPHRAPQSIVKPNKA